MHFSDLGRLVAEFIAALAACICDSYTQARTAQEREPVWWCRELSSVHRSPGAEPLVSGRSKTLKTEDILLNLGLSKCRYSNIRVCNEQDYEFSIGIIAQHDVVQHDGFCVTTLAAAFWALCKRASFLDGEPYKTELA